MLTPRPRRLAWLLCGPCCSWHRRLIATTSRRPFHEKLVKAERLNLSGFFTQELEECRTRRGSRNWAVISSIIVLALEAKIVKHVVIHVTRVVHIQGYRYLRLGWILFMVCWGLLEFLEISLALIIFVREFSGLYLVWVCSALTCEIDRCLPSIPFACFYISGAHCKWNSPNIW